MAGMQKELEMKKFDNRVILHVKITTEFKLRKWIALKLIRLAVIILGCKIEVME